MFPFSPVSRVLFLALFVLTACLPLGKAPFPIHETIYPQPAPTTPRILPTPSSPGDSVTWRDLQIRMDQCEIIDSFTNEFGSPRVPPAGRKFLWVHVMLENVGADEILLPEAENFSALYAQSEFKPVYGHRRGYMDYTALGSTLFPGQTLDAWLRFDIPDTAPLNELWFVFLPTSAQVGVSPSSPTYPYAENKPTFVWKCEP
jgi:hypothetical protein